MDLINRFASIIGVDLAKYNFFIEWDNEGYVSTDRRRESLV